MPEVTVEIGEVGADATARKLHAVTSSMEQLRLRLDKLNKDIDKFKEKKPENALRDFAIQNTQAEKAVGRFIDRLAQAANHFNPFSKAAKNAANDAGKFTTRLDEMARVTRLVEGPLGGTAARMQTLVSIFKTFNSTIAFSLVGLTAFVGALVFFIPKIVQTRLFMDRLEGSLKAATGGTQAAANEFQFLSSEAQRLGLSIKDIGPAYAQLIAASRGTTLEGEATRKVFTGVSEAAAALRLSSDDASGVIRALTQMMSKGTIQAEELRGQLGDRIPGAVNLVAESMGLTTAELNKMMKNGLLLAEDVLPKLADKLSEIYGPEALRAAEALQGSWNRLKNTFLELLDVFDKNVGVSDAISGLAKATDAWLSILTLVFKRVEENKDFLNIADPMTRNFGLSPNVFAKYSEDVDKFADEMEKARVASEKFEAIIIKINALRDEGARTGGKVGITAERAEELTRLAKENFSDLINPNQAILTSLREQLEAAKENTEQQKIQRAVAKDVLAILKQKPDISEKELDAFKQQSTEIRQQIAIRERGDKDRLAALKAQEKAFDDLMKDLKDELTQYRKIWDLQQEIVDTEEQVAVLRKGSLFEHEKIKNIHEDRVEIAKTLRSFEDNQLISLEEQEALARRIVKARRDETDLVDTLKDLEKIRTDKEKERLKELEKQEEALARPFINAAENIQKSFSDMLFDVFTGAKNKSIIESFFDFIKQGFARLLAELTTLALIRPIILPVVSGLAGAMGLGAGAQKQLASAFGVSDLSGGFNIADKLGLNFGPEGISGAINNFGTSLGFGNPALNTLDMLDTSGLGSVVSMPPGTGSLTSASLSGVLGAGGIGALGGGLLNQMIGGNTTFGSIGGGLGAGLGFAVGGPVGGVVGGLAGSLLGGMFGPKKSVGPNANAIIENLDEFAKATQSAADNGGDASSALAFAKEITENINQTLKTLDGRLKDDLLLQVGNFPSKGGLFVNIGETPGTPQKTFGEDTEATANFALLSALKAATFDNAVVASVAKAAETLEDFNRNIELAQLFIGGIGEELPTAAAKMKELAETAREFTKNFEAFGFATVEDALAQVTKTVKEIIVGKPAISATAQALTDLNNLFNVVKDNLDAFGLTLEFVAEKQKEANAALQEGFNKSIGQQILEGQGFGGINTIESIVSAAAGMREDARLVGGNTQAVNQLERINILNVLRDLDPQQLEKVEQFFKGINSFVSGLSRTVRIEKITETLPRLTEDGLLALAEASAATLPELAAVIDAEIERRIALIDEQTVLAKATDTIKEATARIGDLTKLAETFRDLRLSLPISNLSPLSPQAQFDEAKGQIDELIAEVESGNFKNADKLTSLIPRFLEISTLINAHGVKFGQDFTFALAILQRAENAALSQVDIDTQILAAAQATVDAIKVQTESTVNALIALQQTIADVFSAANPGGGGGRGGGGGSEFKPPTTVTEFNQREAAYFGRYPDVAAGWEGNAYSHFIQHGEKEGRSYQHGGFVSNPHSTDGLISFLSPGEFVVPSPVARRIKSSARGEHDDNIETLRDILFAILDSGTTNDRNQGRLILVLQQILEENKRPIAKELKPFVKVK